MNRKGLRASRKKAMSQRKHVKSAAAAACSCYGCREAWRVPLPGMPDTIELLEACMVRCDYCGNLVDERTVSAHGFCIPCMDGIVDAADGWSGALTELTDTMPALTQQIEQLAVRQKAIRKLLREVRAAIKGQPYVSPMADGYLHTCQYCGGRFRGLKLHLRHCPKVHRD